MSQCLISYVIEQPLGSETNFLYCSCDISVNYEFLISISMLRNDFATNIYAVLLHGMRLYDIPRTI